MNESFKNGFEKQAFLRNVIRDSGALAKGIGLHAIDGVKAVGKKISNTATSAVDHTKALFSQKAKRDLAIKNHIARRQDFVTKDFYAKRKQIALNGGRQESNASADAFIAKKRDRIAQDITKKYQNGTYKLPQYK